MSTRVDGNKVSIDIIRAYDVAPQADLLYKPYYQMSQFHIFIYIIFQFSYFYRLQPSVSQIGLEIARFAQSSPTCFTLFLSLSLSYP